MTRLPEQPGEVIDRSRPIAFNFDGTAVAAYAGDTIGSALFAAGRRTFSRSFKYHRRRGLLCCAGHCPNCMVSVDGAPGVRACTEPARDGMRVEHLNARPSLEFDLMGAVDLLGGPFTPPGFYYKTFMRPRRLWPLYERLLRAAAGLGRLPRVQPERTWRTEYRRRHADVLVVGGGRAGLGAAIDAAGSGADVVLVDDGVQLGGRMLFEGHATEAAALRARAAEAGVELQSRASALGFFDGLVPVWQESTLHQIRARSYVFATGTIEQPMLFEGNDLPGVMLPGAVSRLIARYSVAPGSAAVVVGSSDRAGAATSALQDVGIPVVPLVSVQTLVGRGRRRVRSALADGRALDCDLLVVDGGTTPALSLLLQAGATAAYDNARGGLALTSVPDCVSAVGSVAGEREPNPPGPRGSRKRKCFACLCEDVTARDIARTVAEGYDSIELAKRYSTVLMGPCQGRMCQLAATRLLAAEVEQDLTDVGLTTARPPVASVPLGALAGRPFEPAKRSALHRRHRDLGATVMWAGEWRRAYDYGDPEGEALAVQRGAGLIDVSTLGKLIVRGADAAAFLDRCYPNRLGDLAPGRIRYGVLTSDAGRILDDGTVCRLDAQTFYVTTTSSGAGAVEQWFSWWLAEWDMDVTLTDVTQGVAAMNLAGPESRSVLRGLTAIDIGPEVFTYLDARTADVAGVPCLLLRIGFVGELGYEIHCPAPQAGVVWDAILAAGDVRPFGLEPQRILRLQKQHILVGQDTDSESTPFGAAMPWIVKLDKDGDFVGRWALEQAAAYPGPAALVGFTIPGIEVPTEGAVVVSDGRAAGQVTSARFSPRLDHVIGLAWVPAALAHDDAVIEIADRGERRAATVTTRPFYDPEGVLLRS
jgi:sarcosine oxidase subunit alpha